jgi:hypothetical protein
MYLKITGNAPNPKAFPVVYGEYSILICSGNIKINVYHAGR